MNEPNKTIEELVQQSNRGNETARRELFELMYERFRVLSRKMLRRFPGVKRWEQTDDLWQNAGVKLWQSIAKVTIHDARHFHSLAALHIRRELIQLTRHYYGPRGVGSNHASHDSGTDGTQDQDRSFAPLGKDDTYEPGNLAMWTEFHREIEKLPEEERETFDLIWYQGIPQAEVAKLLDVSLRTVKRRWQSARLSLSKMLNHQLPE